jgi:hypothetical protein
VLKPKAAYLVYAGSETWPVTPSVTASPLGSLMKRLAAE